MKFAIQGVGIEKGDRYVARRGLRVAIVQYRSANGSVGYRIKGAKRIYHTTAENFLRNYTPLGAAELLSEPVTTE